ncbi:MAG: hypothetical protein EHM39_14305, partial [Chloroflexi bacterium]
MQHNRIAHRSARLSRRGFLKQAFLAGSAALLPGITPIDRRAQPGVLPLIVDGHIDLGWNIVNFGRDYTRSAYDIRADTAGTPAQQVQGQAMVGLPQLLGGQVALLIGNIFVIPAHLTSSESYVTRYTTPSEANYWGWTMLDTIEALAARSENMVIVQSGVDLDAVLASWAPDQPIERRQVGIILGMEGADPITTPGELQTWYARGLRSIGLSWGRTQYAGSSSEDGELTLPGVQLLNEMKRLGVLLDVAHLSEAAFWQANNLWVGPLVYSHGNSRHYLATERGVSDDQIRVIAERDGLIGIGVYNGFYTQNVITPGQVTVEDVANAIDYVCQLTGDSLHAAIGSDVDGSFGAESAPLGIDTVADLQKIPPALSQRGYQPV